MFARVFVGTGVCVEVRQFIGQERCVHNARAFRTVALDQAVENAVADAQDEVIPRPPGQPKARREIVLVQVRSDGPSPTWLDGTIDIGKQRIQKLSDLLAADS